MTRPSRPAPAVPGDLRVLYITSGWDAPGRYRCVHAVLQLRAAGVVANARHVDDPNLEIGLDAYNLVVLVRVAWSPSVARVVQLARTKGAGLLFDVDDLVFEPGAERLLPFFETLRGPAQREYLALFPRLHRTFDECSGVIASTPTIAAHAEALGKPAWVHRNLLPPTYERSGRWVMRYRQWRQAPPAIVFLSGSNTHDPDLAAGAEPLARVLTDDPTVRLIVGGFAQLPAPLVALNDRVDRLPYLDWRVYPWVFARSRVAIAPAAAINAFTDAKSALKFFEAGAFGIPLLAAPTAEYRAAITNGRDGFLCATPAQWEESLRAALDPAVHERIGRAARATVEAHHTFTSQHGLLAALLAPHAGRAAAAPPTTERLRPRESPRAVLERVKVRWNLLQGPGYVSAPAPPPTLTALESPLAQRVTNSVADGDPSEWFHGGDLRLLPDGSLESTGPDPLLVSAALDLPVNGWRYLRVRIAATPREATAMLQLFWETDDDGGFAEGRSWYAPIAETSTPTTLVFDLHAGGWPRQGRIRRLRFDPLDCRGRITVLELALATAPDGDGTTTVRALCDIGTLLRGSTAPLKRPPVDIVVPVYNAREQVEACVASVLRHAQGDWRLVLIDDQSPDPTIWPALERLAAADRRVVALRNERNLGFTGTANRGMREAAGRDVLLLNSDTIVTAGFLEGLQDCIYADDATGIASALSNNATICSVPDFCRPNAIPAGHTIDTFGALVRATSLRHYPELVTAVGFCMYIRAAVIERIGLLDEAAFGRGYGEENDYCERALAAEFTIRLADDVFVFHEGEASFGADTSELKATNSAVLETRHPGYFAKVARFIETNPLRVVHDNLRLALGRRAGRDPALLVLLHASFDQPAGGTEFHVRQLVEALALPRVVVAVPADDAIHVTEVVDGRLDLATAYRFRLSRPVERFMRDRPDVNDVVEQIVRLFGVDAVHLQHLLSWPVDIWRRVADAGVPFVATLHDYYCVCPSLNLINVADERLCCAGPDGPPIDPSQCLKALFHEMTLPPPTDLRGFATRHRAEFGALLAAAQAVVVPSQAVADIVTRVHAIDSKQIQVIPHGYAPSPARAERAPSGPRLRAAVLGMISHPTKGPRHYRELLERTRHLPIEWHIFGSTDHGGYDAVLASLGLGDRLKLHGAYRRGTIVDALRSHGIDVTVHLPAAPETFSFTLSESLIAGVPAIVNDRGALPERIAACGAGVAVSSPSEAATALEHLASDRGALAALATRAAAFEHTSVSTMAASYRSLYQQLRHAAPAPELSLVDRRFLFEAYSGESPSQEPATLDDLPHYSRWWYPLYARLAPLVPVRWRQRARRRVADRSWRPVAAFSFGRGDDRIVAGPSVELVDRRDEIATYRAADRDPFFLLGAAPLSTSEVRVVRFRMRCRADGYVFAQLYWSHAPEEPFCEEKSVQVPLQATDDQWREYVLRIDDTERSQVWDAGSLIHHLRFDPVNVAATIELRDLFLCRPDAVGPTPS